MRTRTQRKRPFKSDENRIELVTMYLEAARRRLLASQSGDQPLHDKISEEMESIRQRMRPRTPVLATVFSHPN
ncbi:hypothetical protein [Arsenicibacter rosenii]|uniref:hypothetical protein n=1 Tax=Arsenicibacter rosenii TaxID=1750698 RepID=UPI0011606E94|nr:hypothetical protein [Arsenicibacter rosenii]